jgi:hypothetical protein
MNTDNCRQTPWPTYSDGRACVNDPAGLDILHSRALLLPTSLLEVMAADVLGGSLRQIGEEQAELDVGDVDMFEGLSTDEALLAAGSQFVIDQLLGVFERYPVDTNDVAFSFDGRRWHAMTMRTPHFGTSEAWDDIALLNASGIATLPLDGAEFDDDALLATVAGTLDDLVAAAMGVCADSAPEAVRSRLEAARYDLVTRTARTRTLLDHFTHAATTRAWDRFQADVCAN